MKLARSLSGKVLDCITLSAPTTVPDESRIRDTLPAAYKLLSFMRDHELPGRYHLRKLFSGYRLLNDVYRTELENGVTACIPMQLNYYNPLDLAEYEAECMNTVSSVVNSALDDDITCIDCGADIGAITMLFKSMFGERIQRVLAFEPGEWYPWLCHNVGNLPPMSRVEASREAVSDFSGTGTMVMPDYGKSTHSLILQQSDNGDIDVVKIDDKNIDPGKDLLMKIDVEGGEESVVRGARKTIKAAKSVVIICEAHPFINSCTGIDPSTNVVATLEEIRPFRTVISERPDIVVDNSKPFFSDPGSPGHVQRGKVYNFCAVSA